MLHCTTSLKPGPRACTVASIAALRLAASTQRIATVDLNPYLARLRAQPSAENAKGAVERPGEAPNIPWQTRSALPTDYENRLGDALEQVFESGASKLEEIVVRLNALGCLTPDDQPWTVEQFTATMRALAAR